jgi:NADH-quinone oxidoreductase subunit C
VSVDVAAPPASPASSDALLQRFHDNLLADLGDAVIESTTQRRDIYMRVAASDWVRAATAAKRLGFNYFSFLSGMDWLVSPLQTTRYENVWGSVEEEAPVADDASAETDASETPASASVAAGLQTGLAGGNSRFQVMLRVTSTTENRSLVLKADLDETNPTVASIANVYGGANWHERETWEMFGFWFEGHPKLIHIYLPGSFEGYPLRKDFPLLAREVKPWPGLTNVEPIAGEADDAVAADAPAETA